MIWKASEIGYYHPLSFRKADMSQLQLPPVSFRRYRHSKQSSVAVHVGGSYTALEFKASFIPRWLCFLRDAFIPSAAGDAVDVSTIPRSRRALRTVGVHISSSSIALVASLPS